jgi:hypothetical protein
VDSTISGFGAAVDICKNGVDLLYVIKVLEYNDQPIRYIIPKPSEALHQKWVLLMVYLLPFDSYKPRKTKKQRRY